MRTKVILPCAGSSERMGRPKALLEVRAKTFLERVVHIFTAAGVVESILVVGGDDSEAIRAAADQLTDPVTIVDNPDPGAGPIASVRLAIGQAPPGDVDAYLVHPIDIPGLHVVDVRALVTALEANPAADACIPSIGQRRGHPLLLRETLARKVLDLQPDQTLRDVLTDASIEYVERVNELLLLNVNTEADLQQLRMLM